MPALSQSSNIREAQHFTTAQLASKTIAAAEQIPLLGYKDPLLNSKYLTLSKAHEFLSQFWQNFTTRVAGAKPISFLTQDWI